jgi:hypothetical protein
MKISVPPQRREQGMASVIVIAFLAIILIYVSVNARSIICLEREVKLVEKQQIKRLNVRYGATNATSVVTKTPVQASAR